VSGVAKFHEWATNTLNARLSDPNRTTGSYRKRAAASAQTNHSLKPLFDKIGVSEAYADAKGEKDPVVRMQKTGVYVQKHMQFNAIVKKAVARNKANPHMVGYSLGQHAMDIHTEIEEKRAQKQAKKQSKKAKNKKKVAA
jgi:hypothetical protein